MREILNPFSLENKTILVTGASSGIGREIAILCSKMGACIFITARNEERLKETFSKLSGDNHRLFSADMTDEKQIDKMISIIPKLDGIVLNAGITKIAPFKFLNTSDLYEVMNTNFNFPMLFLSKILKKKIINNSSSIVLISSIAGNKVGKTGVSIYAASKGALNGIQKVLALELSKQKIRVNSVNPGIVRSEMWKENTDISTNQFLEDEKNYPLGYGEPKDVANTCVFLLSDASKWMTGSSLVIDGGFTIQ